MPSLNGTMINFRKPAFFLPIPKLCMRLFLTFVSLTHIFTLCAQPNIDSLSLQSIQYPVRGYVLLTNNTKIMIEGASFTNNSKVILFSPGNNMVNGAYTFKGDVRAMQKQLVDTSEIMLLKVKRGSFASGAAVGGAVGFGLGYLGGAISYEEDINDTDEEDREGRNLKGFLFGLGTAIPTALVGGFMGGIFIKKRFPINGNGELLKKTLLKMSNADKKL